MKYGRILDGFPEAVLLMGREIVECNEKTCQLLSCERSDIIGRSLVDISSQKQSDDLDLILASQQRIEAATRGEPQIFPWQLSRKDGARIDVEISIKAINSEGPEQLLMLCIRDLSNINQLDWSGLQHGQNQYRALTEIAPVGIFHTDHEGKFLYVNKRWCEITGFHHEEALNKGLNWGIHVNDREWVLEKWCDAAKKNRPFQAEYRMVHTDGTSFWIYGQIEAVKNVNDKVTGYLGTITDITELKQIQKELQEKNEYIETITDRLPIGFALQTWDLDNPENRRILYMNKQFVTILGWPVEVVKDSQSFWLNAFPDPVYREKTYQMFLAALSSEDPSKILMELQVKRSSGEVADILATIIPMLEKNLLISTFQDISAYKKAEEALRKSEERRIRLQAEIEYAADVQKKLLPYDAPSISGFDIAARCLPASHVGGDFYDWQELAPGLISLTLADVMGKGMAAAMLMATVRATLRTVPHQNRPAASLQLAERALRLDLNRSESFVTLFHAQLDAAARILTFVDCGHGFVFVRKFNGQVIELLPRGLPLGVTSLERYQEGSIKMEEGDALVLYSDGLVDALPDQTLDNEGLSKFLQGADSAEEMLERLFGIVPKDQLLPDDLTIVVVRCHASI